RMRQRLYHWLHHRYAAAGILSLGLLLVLPSLWAGLLADDYAQLLRLHYPDIAPSSGKPGLFHLFFFANDDAQWRQQQYAWNLLPWWTSEQLHIEFFRPL